MSEAHSEYKPDPKKDRRPNRLGRETSPYLRQHAYNPVDWYPWGPEALERAARLDRPIFLSVGYAACHWCHVMEKESFEDVETAKLLNEKFVAVKVDREERPDLDHLYMQAVQALTQRGGWPMSVFLTPTGAPFFAGTYFPLDDKQGTPSFKRVLRSVHGAWEKGRASVEKSAEQLVSALRSMNSPADAGPGEDVAAGDVSLVDSGAKQILGDYDSAHGGLGGAPKFFHVDSWRLMLRSARRSKDAKALAAVRHTLDAISRGGIYDQLRGGFHRYSVDTHWHVPHFEKMLYDNGLLMPLFLEAASAFPKEGSRWLATVRETLDWLLDEMTAPEGGLAATLDADTDGEEGHFYVWSSSDLDAAIADDDVASTFKLAYGVTAEGNWEKTNVLYRAKTQEEVAAATNSDVETVEAAEALARRRLMASRAKRTRPDRDDKVVLPWNGFAIEALALAGRMMGEARYLTAAREAYVFVGSKLRRDDAEGVCLYHSYKDGAAKVMAFLDGYGALGKAALALFSATGEPVYLNDSVAIAMAIEARFFERKLGDFTFSAKDAEALVTPVFDRHDGATPSALALAVGALVGTYRATGIVRFRVLAETVLAKQRSLLARAPQASANLLLSLDALTGAEETLVVVEGDDAEAFAEAVQAVGRKVAPERTVLPFSKSAQADTTLAAFPAFAGKIPVDGTVTLYRCAAFQCDAPTVGTEAIERAV